MPRGYLLRNVFCSLSRRVNLSHLLRRGEEFQLTVRDADCYFYHIWPQVIERCRPLYIVKMAWSDRFVLAKSVRMFYIVSHSVSIPIHLSTVPVSLAVSTSSTAEPTSIQWGGGEKRRRWGSAKQRSGSSTANISSDVLKVRRRPFSRRKNLSNAR